MSYIMGLIKPKLSALELGKIAIFSSSEHNVLRVSYCDRSMSDVRPCVRLSLREQLLQKSSPLKPANRFQ